MKLLRLAGKTVERFRTEGSMQTLRRSMRYLGDVRSEWIERGFDRRYGTDTLGILEPGGGMIVVGENGAASRGYEGIQVPVFRDIVRHLPIRLQDYTFLDFGSGKGRALMMAAEHGFQRAVGVEFSPVLHDIARTNVARFRRAAPTASPIELRCEDAVRFEIPDGNLVCFFYNPFNCEVMRRVVTNIERACSRGGSRILVVYRNPVCAHVLDASGCLKLHYACRAHRIYDSGAVRES